MLGTLRLPVLGQFYFLLGFSTLVSVSEDSHSLMGGSDVVTSLGFSPIGLGGHYMVLLGCGSWAGDILYLLYSVLGRGRPTRSAVH